MFEKCQTWLRGVLGKMFHKAEIKRALQVELAMSSSMEEAITLWLNMFCDAAPWLDRNTQSLGLPAAIAGELARLVTVELSSSIEGSPRADFLQESYAKLLDKLRVDVELALAAGGVVFKPRRSGDGLVVDCVPAWSFAPTAVDERGEISGAIFHEELQRGGRLYTRIEGHTREGDQLLAAASSCTHSV